MESQNIQNELLNFNEASSFLKISKSHLYGLTHAKQIPHYKPNGKKIYFLKSELLNWILKGKIETKQ